VRVALELQLLAAAVLVGLVHLLWAAAAAQPQRGLKWNVGSRATTPVILTGMAGRLERAFANFRETFPLFAAAVLGAYLGGPARHAPPMARCSTWRRGWSTCRSTPSAFRYVRSLVWLLSLIGIGLVLAALVI
jgi:uncharacterized MAPEG superfamily protein